MTIVNYTEVGEGDVIQYRDVLVKIIRPAEPCDKPDRFGRMFDQLWGERLDTHQQGSMVFGPTGVVHVIDPPTRRLIQPHPDETYRWADDGGR